MIRWIQRRTQTRTQIHSAAAEERQRRQARASAFRMLAAVQLTAQLLLWVTFSAYDRCAQAVWQAALMLLVPLAALWFLWRAGVGAWQTKAGKIAALPLLLCLLLDSMLLAYVFCGFFDSLIPEYPYPVGAIALCALCLLAVLASRREGTAYGLSALKYPLLLCFLLGTLFLRASSRGDRLWPLLGSGFGSTAMTALLGAGSLWSVALLVGLPAADDPLPAPRSSLWAIVPWVIGSTWALWYGFIRPWIPGDTLSVGVRLMGLARHAEGVVNYQLAGLLWLLLLPCALCGCISSSELLLCRTFPQVPRWFACSLPPAAALATVLIWPEALPNVLEKLLPWRAAVSLLCGAAMLIIARKERAA